MAQNGLMTTAISRRAIGALLLVLLTAGAFYPGLSGGFLFDDFPNIVTNPRVHAESLDAATLLRAAKAYEPGIYGRPLATLSFAVDFYLAGGKHPWQFKLTSLLVHLVNALLVLALVRRLMVAGSGHGRTWLAALAITFAWSAHPLQVSSVLYIVQRMETLSLTFVLAGLCFYVSGRLRQREGTRGWIRISAGFLLAGIGLLSKETAALFPAYTLALELTLLQFDAKSESTSRRWRQAYLALCIAAAAAFLVLILPMYLDPESYRFREFTLAERLLTQLRVLPMYLGWILLPLPGHLHFYYDNFEVSRGLLSPATTLLGGLFLTGLLLLAFRIRRSWPYLSLGIFWFFCSHALTSNVVPFELVFEHRNYFSVLAIALVVFDLVRRIPVPDGPHMLTAGISAVLLGYFVLTGIRSAVWGDTLLLASVLVSNNPDSPRASNDLGEQYMFLADRSASSPFYDMAEREFERGSRLPGASPLPEQALLLLAATAGQPAKAEWWDSLDRKLRERTIGPQEKMAMLGLLSQRYKGVELDDARLGQALEVLYSREPMPPSAYAQFGDFALVYLEDEALADRMFAEAISAPPRDPAYLAQIISVLSAESRPRQVDAVLARARELGLTDAGPGDTPTLDEQ